MWANLALLRCGCAHTPRGTGGQWALALSQPPGSTGDGSDALCRVRAAACACRVSVCDGYRASTQSMHTDCIRLQLNAYLSIDTTYKWLAICSFHLSGRVSIPRAKWVVASLNTLLDRSQRAQNHKPFSFPSHVVLISVHCALSICWSRYTDCVGCSVVIVPFIPFTDIRLLVRRRTILRCTLYGNSA